ncbi:MAG: endonuclease/exonuclease/phosphatase family protein [Deltaproteobacteria bacterium]|nr:endonuclease/exonuclease/phosphatase family protein [Deltaproteobacteria bacterium]
MTRIGCVLLLSVACVADEGVVSSGSDPRVPAPIQIATYNLENLSPFDLTDRYVAFAQAIVTELGAPEILAVQEIQDSDGNKNTGRVDATVTIDRLLAALAQAGVPGYRAVQLDPRDGHDGGMPGANIRPVVLLRGSVELAEDPVRLGENSAAFVDSRKPLVVRVTHDGRPLTIVNVHFASGRADTTVNRDDQRLLQAQMVAQFVNAQRAQHPATPVVVLGDLNDKLDTAPLLALTGAGLFNLMGLVPLGERHTYVHSGNPVVLDHILVTDTLRSALDFIRVKGTLPGPSDHRPVLARFFP